MSGAATEQQGNTSGAPEQGEYRPTEFLSSDQEAADDQRREQGNEVAPADEQAEQDEAGSQTRKGDEAAAQGEKSPEERQKEERRRYDQLTRLRYQEKARADAAEAQRASLEAELAKLRGPQQNQEAELERRVEERARKLMAEQQVERQVADFHAAGRAAYPDWAERCQNLQDMGADAQIAQLLVELPNGAAVAGALADNPADLERIAGLRTERARAIELGRYSAGLSSKAAATPQRGSVPEVTRLTAPIRPPTAGRARGEPDPNGSIDDYNKWSQTLDWNAR